MTALMLKEGEAEVMMKNIMNVLITNDKYLCLQTIAFMRWVALIHPITNQALRGWILGWASGCQCHLCQIEGKISLAFLGFITV